MLFDSIIKFTVEMGRQINFLIPGVHSITTSTVKRRKYFCCQLLVRYNFTDPEGCS